MSNLPLLLQINLFMSTRMQGCTETAVCSILPTKGHSKCIIRCQKRIFVFRISLGCGVGIGFFFQRNIHFKKISIWEPSQAR